MKVLLVIALALVSLQASEGRDFDWSKVKPQLPPAYNPNYVPKKYPTPPKRAATVDMRAVCGQPNPPVASRIVGGWEAGVHEFPWQAALFINGGSFCGGSLISDQWVLTAAHCAESARYYDIYLGAHNVRETEDFRQEIRVTVNAENNIIHPNWNANSLRGDMALIKLPQPVTFSDIIRPICLPAANEADQHVGEVEIATGWGRPSDSVSSISPVLRKTNTTVISNTQCRQVYGSIVTADHICIGTEDGHGTCNGDSGGPLSHVNVDGTFTQIGVVSFGSSAGCEAGYPDAFSRLSNYMEWVSSVTGIVY